MCLVWPIWYGCKTYLVGVSSEESFTGLARHSAEVEPKRVIATHQANLSTGACRHHVELVSRITWCQVSRGVLRVITWGWSYHQLMIP